MIKHRVFTLEFGADNEDICDERLDACLNDGWRIVSYLPNVVDDSGTANEPGSVYTEVMVVLAKEEGRDAKDQERHNCHMSDFMALLKMNDLAKCDQLSRCDVDDDENEVKTQAVKNDSISIRLKREELVFLNVFMRIAADNPIYGAHERESALEREVHAELTNKLNAATNESERCREELRSKKGGVKILSKTTLERIDFMLGGL